VLALAPKEGRLVTGMRPVLCGRFDRRSGVELSRKALEHRCKRILWLRVAPLAADLFEQVADLALATVAIVVCPRVRERREGEVVLAGVDRDGMTP